MSESDYFANQFWSLGRHGTKGSTRLFFGKCASCGQHKVLFIQKCTGQTSNAPEGIKTHWRTPKVLLGVKSDAGYLCDSCGHFKDRHEYLSKIENQVRQAEKKLDEIRVVIEL